MFDGSLIMFAYKIFETVRSVLDAPCMLVCAAKVVEAVQMLLLARLIPRVPVVVIGPPVSVPSVATEVTVPVGSAVLQFSSVPEEA